MKSTLLAMTLSLAATPMAFAGAGHDDMMEIGQAAEVGMETRTIQVKLMETEDGDMVFEPRVLDMKAGETVRLAIENIGELEHEFVMDTVAAVAKHKEVMNEFPEMEHDDPNAVRLAPGEKDEIVWTFANAGSFQFACLIPGHYEAGMHGALSVSAATQSIASAETFTKGVVKKIDAEAGKVTIIHEELVDLEMPAMTMVFRVADAAMLETLSEGEEIEFVAARVEGKLTVTKLQ